MSDAHTQVSSLNSAGNEAFDKMFWYALRPELHFAPLATVIGDPFHNRGTHTFNITDDLAVSTSALTETSDPDAVAMSDTEVQVTLTEYGRAINITEKAEGQDIYGINARGVNVIARNAAVTFDTLARDQLTAGSNVQFVGQTAQSSITASDTMSTAEIRKGVARLRGDSAPHIRGSAYYAGFMHPDTTVDLRNETGVNGWGDVVNEADAMRRWQGLVGVYEGVAWVETPRVVISADAGSSTVDVYDNLIVGDEALAKVFSPTTGPMPKAVRGPIVDKLERFRPYGWKWHGGFGRFREACLQRVESASSIGSN